MNTTIKAAKAALRKKVKASLDALSTEEKSRQSALVYKKLMEHHLYKNSKRLSIFLNMPDEVHTEPILKHALDTGKSVYIPRYDSKSSFMDMVRLRSWEEYEALPVTRWNIKQPPLSELCETALTSGGLDLILMPGLAFTKEGHRLGRGRGYYDTYLTKCREIQATPPYTVALTFSVQIVPEVPVEVTDVPVNFILSP